MGRRPTPSTQCGPKAHTLCSPSLSEARGGHSVTQVIHLRPTPKVKVCPLIEVWDKVCNGRRATALPPPCTGTLGGRWARAWRKTKRCHAHPIAQPGGEHLPRQSTPIMCAQPGSVRVVCTRVRARVEPGATTGAREYTGSSSLTFPAPAHNHAELSGGNRHSAPGADVLGVTHRLPPLALDLSA
jgi:hypothetical protein